jgi:hypothetical protein
MRGLGFAFALASVALALPIQAPPSIFTDGLTSTRHRRGKGQDNRRGKGLKAKPKKRPNRLTISKRVRRKHRRAA